MNRWRALVAMMVLFAIGCPLGHARKLVIFKHGGDAFQGWLTLKVIDVHKEHHGPGLNFFRERDPLPFLQKHASGLHELGRPSQSFVCDTCMDISTFAEQVLTNPDTMGNVLDYVNGSLCKALPTFQDECVSLAKMYVPNLVEMLEVYAAPDKLCGETNLCPSAAMLLLNDARTCKICTDFATKALSYAQDSKTEQEVMDALHAQCAKLGDFSSKCDNLVDTYGPLYINKLDSTTPEQVCQKVGMCSSSSFKDPSDCATCEFAVYQLKKKLQNPATQEKMLELLVGSCAKMPAHVDQCQEIVNQYAPVILANIDSYVNAEAICTEIHACESKKKLSDDILIELPTVRESIAHQEKYHWIPVK